MSDENVQIYCHLISASWSQEKHRCFCCSQSVSFFYATSRLQNVGDISWRARTHSYSIAHQTRWIRKLRTDSHMPSQANFTVQQADYIFFRVFPQCDFQHIPLASSFHLFRWDKHNSTEQVSNTNASNAKSLMQKQLHSCHSWQLLKKCVYLSDKIHNHKDNSQKKAKINSIYTYSNSKDKKKYHQIHSIFHFINFYFFNDTHAMKISRTTVCLFRMNPCRARDLRFRPIVINLRQELLPLPAMVVWESRLSIGSGWDDGYLANNQTAFQVTLFICPSISVKHIVPK